MKSEITLRDLYDTINDFREEIRSSYVSKDEFNNRVSPVERLVYGMVGIILVAVLGALIALVINKTGVNAIW